MNKRIYFIGSVKTGRTRQYPILSLSGDWLNEIGFSSENLITVEFVNGYLEAIAHEKGIDTYTRIYKNVFEKKQRLIQIGTEKRGVHIRPTFALSGKWFQELGFETGSVVVAKYEYGIIRLMVIDVDKYFLE